MLSLIKIFSYYKYVVSEETVTLQNNSFQIFVPLNCYKTRINLKFGCNISLRIKSLYIYLVLSSLDP